MNKISIAQRFLMGLALVFGWAFPSLAHDEDKPQRKTKTLAQLAANKPSNGSEGTVTATQETQAIQFVEKHHPELADLLVVLKSMNRDKYDSAIRDVTKSLRRLEVTQKRDGTLYELDVEGWKIQSKIDLTLARGVARDKDFDQAALRSLVEQRVNNQKKRLERELDVLKERENALRESLNSLEKNSREKVDQQFATLLKKLKANSSDKSKDTKGSKPDR